MSKQELPDQPESKWTQKWHNIIFGSDTFAGRLFDEVLLALILLSIGVVMLESIDKVRQQYGALLMYLELIFTFLFTLEYVLRILVSPKPRRYVLSFLGIVDLLAILPTYLAFMIPGAQSFIVIRAIRLLRIYRILKLYRYVRAGNLLLLALRNSSRKILIFMGFILVLVILLGSLMYVIEQGENGFYSIPMSIYWAVITLTTVGYGDIVPMTDLGKFIATFIMLLGYSIIAIPTGIVSVEMARASAKENLGERECRYCNDRDHDPRARFCKTCGNKL